MKKLSLEPKHIYMIASGVFALGLIILVVAILRFSPAQEGTSIVSLPTIVEEKDPCPYRRTLDGICVLEEDNVNPKLVAVMVENHFESWPQSGMAAARVVYEAPVEGNITRFLLLYTEGQEVPKIGPVRSARPYYLDWLAEYGTPLYMHVGGSNEALSLINSRGVNDLNEMSRGWYFWRSSDRYAPHNTYTSDELWNDALERYEDNYTNTEYEGWKFDDVPACTASCTEYLSLRYSGLTYTSGWEYSTTTETYLRDQAGDADIDSDGSQMMADTVIVQFVDTTVLDSVGRLGMDTIGTGESIVFQKGYVIPGTWKKDRLTDRTRYYAEDGNEIILQAGRIWVQVINRDAVTFG